MITINGKTYHGRNVSVINGAVIIDGQVQDGTVNGVVELRVTGDLCNLLTDASVSLNGSVSGDVKAAGSVNCGNVSGNVRAGGSVCCDAVSGNVSAGGSVSHG